MTNFVRNPIENLVRSRLKLFSVIAEEVEGTITDAALFIRSKEQGAQTNEISVEYAHGVFIVRGPKPPTNYALKTLTDGKVTFFKQNTDVSLTLTFNGLVFTDGTITVAPGQLFKHDAFMIRVETGASPFSQADQLIIGNKQVTETYNVSTSAELRIQCAGKSKLIELPVRGFDMHDKNSNDDPLKTVDYQDVTIQEFPQTFLTGGTGLTTTKPPMQPGWLQPVRRIINREDVTGKPVMEPKTYYWQPTGEITGYWTTQPLPANLNQK